MNPRPIRMAPDLVTPSGQASRMQPSRAARGSVSVELAILSLPLVMLIVLAILTGRTETAYNAITVAAHDAARAASISHTGQDAAEQAQAVAQTTLAEQGLVCRGLEVEVDASQFTRPVGEPAAVAVTITCALTFDDLGLGFTRRLEATFTSPIDRFRGRS